METIKQKKHLTLDSYVVEVLRGEMEEDKKGGG
jgi:hypothetical protein